MNDDMITHWWNEWWWSWLYDSGIMKDELDRWCKHYNVVMCALLSDVCY